MNNYSDKDFFKDMKKEVKEYSDNIPESFPYFCLKIFWDDLSKDDIEDAMQGLKTNDESIDAFFVDEKNKEINIIQCKSCISEKKQSALNKGWLSYLDGVLNKLENHHFIDNHKNSQIKEIAEEYIKYKKQGYKPKLHLFHLGRADKNILSHYKDRIIYYDWDKIKNEYQEYLSKMDRTEPPSIDILLRYALIEPLIGNKHKTLVSIITGDEIVRLRQEYRYKLFDKNLRFGLGKNKINKGIMETAKGEPDNFYFFNNGITITSKGFKYRQTNSKLTIEYPQIINGAQTVNAIYAAFIEKKSEIARRYPDIDKDTTAKEFFKDIRLLFRIILDDEKDGKKTSDFEEKVIRYNNSQNSIKETDFYANEPEQIELQRLFSGFGYFYEIKRGDRKYLEESKEEHNLLKMKKKNFKYWEEKIDIEKLASLWMAYQVDPALDKVQKGNIFGYAQDKYYDKIFKKNNEITEYQVKDMILAWNLFDLISKQSDIYGNTIKRGQIISKASSFTKDTEIESFENIKEIVANSFLFGEQIKKDFQSQDKFLGNKDALIEQIKKYRFFSHGRYLTLAIFNLILEKCKYKNYLISESDTFRNKATINKYIIEPWLKIILKELIMKEYTEKFDQNKALKTFYTRNDTWENIQKRFNSLNLEEDKEFTEIFNFNINE